MMLGITCLKAVLAAVSFGTPFSDNAVLQRGREIPVWGRADPGAWVEVRFGGHVRTAEASADGRWRVKFGPLEASSVGRDLTASDDKACVTAKNVVVGEVWFASGQSNMECPIVNPGKPRYRDGKGGYMVAMTQLPLVRFVKTARVPRLDSDRTEPTVEWRTFTPDQLVKGEYPLSAVAFYFARELHLALGVPVGIVDSSWGGSGIDAWTPRTAYAFASSLLAPTANYPVTIPWKGPRKSPIVGVEQQPCVLWNGMVRDFAPMAMRGFIWYQGCQNVDDVDLYSVKMHALYDGWAAAFENPDLKLCFVQINPLGSWTPKFNAVARQQQAFADEEKNAFMVVGSDTANPSDVHPNDKETVAQRLALQALKNAYGFPIEDAESPRLERAEFVGHEARLTFAHAKGFHVYMQGARQFNPPFEVAGKDGVWHKAVLSHVNRDTYRLEGGSVTNGCNTLVVSSPEVATPVRARYLAIPGTVSVLFNELGLPLGHFETK